VLWPSTRSASSSDPMGKADPWAKRIYHRQVRVAGLNWSRIDPGVVVRPHERTRPHGRNAFSTSLFRRGGLRSTRATSRVSRPRHRHSKPRLFVQAPRAADPIHGASTQPHDTLTSRNDAARVFSVRTRDRTPRSERPSNATDRILRDDPASLKGWARPYSHTSL
jgi:hypothetical protein